LPSPIFRRLPIYPLAAWRCREAGIPQTKYQVSGEWQMAEYAEDGMVVRTGSLEIDVPRSLGFFGGIAAGVALGLLEPPLALFIAAVPFVKMLSDQRAPTPMRFIGLRRETGRQQRRGNGPPVPGTRQIALNASNVVCGRER
jgi:hypothetical protein